MRRVEHEVKDGSEGRRRTYGPWTHIGCLWVLTGQTADTATTHVYGIKAWGQHGIELYTLKLDASQTQDLHLAIG